MNVPALEFPKSCKLDRNAPIIEGTEMTVILETNRLILRHLVMDDLDELYDLYLDPEITRYIPDAPVHGKRRRRNWNGTYTAIPVTRNWGCGQPSTRKQASLLVGAGYCRGRLTVNRKLKSPIRSRAHIGGRDWEARQREPFCNMGLRN